MHCTSPDKFEVKVLDSYEKEGKFFARLDNNQFFNDGSGGQLGDRGTIGKARVVFSFGDKVETNVLIQKGWHEAFVDIKRRIDISQQHSAQHILSSAIEKKCMAKTLSFHMGESVSTIDLDLNSNLDEAEKLANEIVTSDIVVDEIIIEHKDVAKYPLRKKLSDKALLSSSVRIIKIGDFDVNACAGFHVSRTGEIGIIKIIKTERVKGGLTRVWFLAGMRAFLDYKKKSEEIDFASKVFGTSWKNLYDRAKKCSDDSKNKNTKIKKLSEDLASHIAKSIKKGDVIEVDDTVASFVTRLNQDTLYAIKTSDPANVTICAPGVAKEDIMSFVSHLNAKGGGNNSLYRFSFPDFEKFQKEWERFVSER